MASVSAPVGSHKKPAHAREQMVQLFLAVGRGEPTGPLGADNRSPPRTVQLRLQIIKLLRQKRARALEGDAAK